RGGRRRRAARRSLQRGRHRAGDRAPARRPGPARPPRRARPRARGELQLGALGRANPPRIPEGARPHRARDRGGDELKVALVHDWLTGMRGGEKVLLSLARLYPEAPIFTLLHVKGSVAPELESREIRTSFVQHLPAVAKRYRHYLPLFPRAAESLDLAGFDLVFSSPRRGAKGVRPAPGALHLSYCHTPMRYVWDRYDDYFGPGRVSPLARLVIRPIAARLRSWDAKSSARVHHFAANSAYVAGRIRRYYGRDSAVIPPPVDTGFFTPGADVPGQYDLVVSPLAPYKRLELCLEAYRGTGRRLRIVGSGPEAARLRAKAPAEVEFLGHVGDSELRELYRAFRGGLLPGIDTHGCGRRE